MFERAPRAPRASQPLGETRTEASQEQTPIPPALSTPAPFAAPRAPVAFREVSEHDQAAPSEESPHKPVRRRRRGGEGADAEQPAALQLVETQSEVAVATPSLDEDEASRRPVRRRRRGSAPLDNGPLQLVETAPGSEPRDNPPA